MIPIVFYSHSDYSDVWAPMISQTHKYLKQYKKYLFTDKLKGDHLLDNSWNVILYDDSLRYQDRVLSCLKKVKEEIIFFHHEDMFLYDNPDETKLKEIINLVTKGEIDIVKLIRASYNQDDVLLRNTTHENIYENPKNLNFAIGEDVR